MCEVYSGVLRPTQALRTTFRCGMRRILGDHTRVGFDSSALKMKVADIEVWRSFGAPNMPPMPACR